MRHTLLLLFILFTSLMTKAQNDPVVMRIGDNEIRLGEFVYAYHKNYPESERDRKSLEAFADSYLDYQLKVKAALDAGLDTIQGVKQSGASGESLPARTSFGVDPQVENEAHLLYKSARAKVEASGGMVKPAHILLALPQNANERQRRQAQRRADSLYQAIKAGADFKELASKYSDDKSTAAKGGELPWLSKGQIVELFERVAYSLEVGEVSRPFLSEFGYHIIKLKDKQPFYPYEAQRDELYRHVELNLLRKGVTQDTTSDFSQNRSTKAKAITFESTKRKANADRTENFSLQDKEYRDAALVYEITDKVVWQKARHDEKALASYFKRHKKSFRWKQPRFSGVAFYVRTYEDAKKARQLLKGQPATQWKDILENTFNRDSVIGIRVETGLFLPGDHPLVDRDIYRRAVQPSPYIGLHIGTTYGKLLRKGPSEYTEVRELVLADYQEHLENEWVANLRKHYRPTVYWEELIKAL